MKTKGTRKAESRRRLRHVGTGDSTKMLGNLAKYNFGDGLFRPKNSNPQKEEQE